MSNYERSIVSIIEPSFKLGATSQGKLLLDELFIEDTESPEAKTTPENPGNVRPSDFKTSSRAGSLVPMIAINSTIIQEEDMVDFEIDMSDKIPRLMFTFQDGIGRFNINAPIDGDVISVYIRPPDIDNQKPIRIDFIVTRVLGEPSDKSYFIVGEMKIPKFYSETYKSYPENTSFEHLGDVCEELGLGFASNETATDDKMIRIIPAETYQTFVEETVDSAYKDEDSFFDWYIDPYYFLCLVNVNKQFSLDDKSEEINITDEKLTSAIPGQGETSDSIKGSLVLTNLNTMSGKNVFIKNYSFENNSGKVWTSNGYRRYAQWLSIEDAEPIFDEAFAEALTTAGAEDKYILLKGRRSDGPPNYPKPTYLEENRYKWMGKQAGLTFKGNVHDNYCYSQVLNHQNLEELKKTRLVVDIAGMNHYLYKYQRIPILIYESSVAETADLLNKRDEALGETEDPQKDKEGKGMMAVGEKERQTDGTQTGTNDARDQIKNEFLSGYYVIADIKIKFDGDSNGLSQRLTLIRREWPIPAKNKNS
jgi:hypothetical protein